VDEVGNYEANAIRPYVWYWNILAFVVNLTFYPWDGPGHCAQAYEKEKVNEFFYTENPVALFLLSLFTLGSCIIMAPIFWVIYAVKGFINVVTTIKK